MSEQKSHWENIYTIKAPNEVSWYQLHPETSLELISRTGVEKTAQIIDVGGGASSLVDDLLSAGFKNITVLDIATAAIEKSKERLGELADDVIWIEADVTQASLPHLFYDVWHDRAVFHFLTNAKDRLCYINTVKESLKQGGHIVIATFAPDGPKKCSGLDTVRYSPQDLQREFGDNFLLVESVGEVHRTPFNTEQKFTYCLFQKA